MLAISAIKANHAKVIEIRSWSFDLSSLMLKSFEFSVSVFKSKALRSKSLLLKSNLMLSMDIS